MIYKIDGKSWRYSLAFDVIENKKSSNKIAILGIGINIAWGTNNNQFNASALYDCMKFQTFDASTFSRTNNQH
ncbi:MAG: hypothetical protein CM15mP58_07480 [Burkholderiaceae bacterium]|nr:MAG: hypothetical protein CM15mP58_07480 [Burkholderiaceae bacterium]